MSGSTIVENASAPLAAALEQTTLSWSAVGSAWLADAGTAQIRAEVNGEGAVFASELIERNGLAAPSRRALAAFLDEVNRRWHAVRGLLDDDSIVVQVILPVAAWSPDKIENVVETLLFAHRRLKKECAAILHEQVAQLYLQFHEGENDDGNHDD